MLANETAANGMPMGDGRNAGDCATNKCNLHCNGWRALQSAVRETQARSQR
jgi:hypothetical protein